jgi:hypothetical protein
LKKKGELDAKSCKRRAAWKMALKWKSKNEKIITILMRKLNKNTYSWNVSKLAGRHSILYLL